MSITITPPRIDDLSDKLKNINKSSSGTIQNDIRRSIDGIQSDFKRDLTNTLCATVQTGIGILTGSIPGAPDFKLDKKTLGLAKINPELYVKNAINKIKRSFEQQEARYKTALNDLEKEIDDVVSGKYLKDQLANVKRQAINKANQSISDITNKALREIGLEGCKNQPRLVNGFLDNLSTDLGNTIDNVFNQAKDDGLKGKNTLQKLNSEFFDALTGD